MQALYFVLLLAGLMCFLLEAFSTRFSSRIHFLALGLSFWISVTLIQVGQRL